MPTDPGQHDPYFSVVIAAYNCEAHVGETIESILRQDFASYEILVVDDGSTDGTAAVLAGFGDRVRVLRHEGGTNRHLGATRNRGAAEARGRYLAFLDADDIWLPWTLRIYRDAIERHGQPSFIAGARTSFADGQSPYEGVEETPLRTRAYEDFFRSRPSEGHFLPSGVAMRTDAFRSVGGFWEERSSCSDIDLWMRAGVLPGFVRIDAPVIVNIRRAHESMSVNASRKADGLARVTRLEASGAYPGGRERRRDRRGTLADYLRRGSYYASETDLRSAWRIYRLGLPLNVELGAWSYLLAFPARSAARRRRGRRG